MKHSSLVFLLLSSLILSRVVHGQEDHREDLRGSIAIEGQSFPYRLMFPDNLSQGVKYPLMLFLHGAGERGSDNEAQTRHFPERMASEKYRKYFPFFVLSPQCPEGASWADGGRGLAQGGPLSADMQPALAAAMEALVEVTRTQPIDLNNIYVTGLSMGGAGTWELATRHPDLFAAAMPICGGGDWSRAHRMLGLPLSVWQGADDGLIQPERSREMVDRLRDLGGSLEYHELDGVGHNAWERAYDLERGIAWMLRQRLRSNRAFDQSCALLAGAMADGERIAFLGDSITEAGDRPHGYLDRIRLQLARSGANCKVIPAGISGHKVPDLLKRYRKDVIDAGATLVFLYIGINDVWHSDWGKGTSPEDFESGLRTMIQDFRKSGAEVVLATPSVIGEKDPGQNRLDQALADYAAISRRVAREEGAVLCDLQRAFGSYLRLFNPDQAEKGVLTSDGVHLNGEGNQLVALEAVRSLYEVVRRRAQRSDERTLRVFLLAGQSNMEGKGAVNTLDHMGDDPALKSQLASLKDEQGAWRTRDDVWISYLDRWGRLTTGYGSPAGAHGALIGPELGFGWALGDHLEDPVLLVKTAWGGKDLAVDFLPPSAGGPGPYYEQMVEGLRRVMGQAEELFPGASITRAELAGFLWFQGWNDMVDEQKTAAYPERLEALIRDLRVEFDSPNLPVVVGELGVGGPQPSDGVARFRAAQAKGCSHPDFEGNVRFATTSELYDIQAHALYEADVWKGEDKARYYRVASDRPYHYLGSGKVQFRMGRAFGAAMIEMLNLH